MTVSVVTGLALQTMAVWIIHIGIRGRWISHIGAIFLAVAVAYHGLTEVMQWIWPGGRNSYRKLIGQSPMDDWLLAVSAALLAYAIIFVITLRTRHRNELQEPSEPVEYLRGIRIKWLLIAVAPLILLTATGSQSASYDPNGGNDTGSLSVAGGLVQQFLIPLSAIAAAALIAAKGQRWILPTLGGLAAIMALDGDRRSIIFATVITLYTLALAKVRIPRTTLAAAVAAAVLLILSVSASRAVLGRGEFYAGAGADTRSTALMSGGSALGSSEAWSGIKDETVDRLDGNTFGALINLQLHSGIPGVGVSTIDDSLRLAVPAFLLPGKNDVPLIERNEEVFIQKHFALSVDDDFIPGLFGTAVGYYGWPGLIIVAMLTAFLLALLDRSIHRRASPVRLALGSGLVLAVLLYEQGLPGLLTIGRSGVALAVGLWLVQRSLRWRAARSETGDDQHAAGGRVAAGTGVPGAVSRGAAAAFAVAQGVGAGLAVRRN
jgi:hypothetical protein